jgi:S1-C subfamily serine protease
MGMGYNVVEVDRTHDIALCLAPAYSGALERIAQNPNDPTNPDLGQLELSPTTPPAGTIVAVMGFPLGSWNPSFQVGVISATETVNPSAPGVPAGTNELLQIGVTANKGNSGSPVIEVKSGKVIGMIIQEMPAPLFSPTPNLAFGQNSGIAFAVPAKWIIGLLEKHKIAMHD